MCVAVLLAALTPHLFLTSGLTWDFNRVQLASVNRRDCPMIQVSNWSTDAKFMSPIWRFSYSLTAHIGTPNCVDY